MTFYDYKVRASVTHGSTVEHFDKDTDAEAYWMANPVAYKGTHWTLFGVNQRGVTTSIGVYPTRAAAASVLRKITEGTTDIAEAAMCIWEDFLTSGEVRYPAWQTMRDQYGTSVVRQHLMSMATRCHLDWMKAVDLEDYHEPFDWEFVPDWLIDEHAKESKL